MLGPFLLMLGRWPIGPRRYHRHAGRDKHSALVIDESGLLTGKLKNNDKIGFSYSP